MSIAHGKKLSATGHPAAVKNENPTKGASLTVVGAVMGFIVSCSLLSIKSAPGLDRKQYDAMAVRNRVQSEQMTASLIDIQKKLDRISQTPIVTIR